MLCGNGGRWLIAAGVLAVLSFGVSHLVVRARPTTRAFTLKTEVYGFPDGQKPVLRHWMTVAVRSDGTRVDTGNLSGRPGKAGETERIISFMDGGNITYRPGIAAKTTFGPRPDMAAGRRSRLFNPPPNCLYPGFTFVSYDTIAGEPVVLLSHNSGPPMNWGATTWMAPRLGCEQLQYRSYDKQADSTYKLMTEMRTVSLTFGEPDPKLFDQPSSGYQEMKPSDTTRAYDRKYGHILEHEDKQLLDQADQNYFGKWHKTLPQSR